jgi:hypothetical protein
MKARMQSVLSHVLVAGLVIMSAIAVFFGLGPAVRSVAAAQNAVGACSLLPKELALKVTSVANRSVFDMPPSEEKAGANGTACNYGDIRVQLTGAAADETFTKNPQYVPVPGLGSRAWIRENRTRYAELVVTTGTRSLWIQMGVPAPAAMEKVKANAVTLARELLPKIK